MSSAWVSWTPNQQLIYNLNLLQISNNSNGGGSDGEGDCLQPWGPHPTAYNGRSKSVKRFSDGSYNSFDPWIAWSSLHLDADPRVRGMFWDAVFVMDGTPAGDTVATFDSKTWTCISNLQTPSLWVISA